MLPDPKVSRTMDDSVAVDRLSELPNETLHLIMVFLPVRDALTTREISKRWKDLATTNPRLRFCYRKGEDLEKFFYFVGEVLRRWEGNEIMEFRIDLKELECSDFGPEDYNRFCDRIDNHVGSWVRFAVERNVEDLTLQMGLFTYFLPDEVYSLSSIRKLELIDVEVEDKVSVSWKQLTHFTLVGSINLPDVIDHLLKGSPLLEYLDLEAGLSCLEICIRSTKLKRLCITYALGEEDPGEKPRATVSAPLLESLGFGGILFTSCLLKLLSFEADVELTLEPSSSWRTEVGDMFKEDVLGNSHAIRLKVNKWSLMLLVDKIETEEHDAVLFSTAKFLKICADDDVGLLTVLEMFPQLEMLIVECEEVGVVVYDLPIPQSFLQNLKKVDITYGRGNKSVTPLETALRAAPVLNMLVVRFGRE